MKYIVLMGLLISSSTTFAASLAEVIDRRIEDKAAEMKPKDAGAAMVVNDQNVIAAPKATQDSITPDDIQITGILGVGDNLKARVVIKNSQPISMTAGQPLQGGWVLASLTPNMVTFELRKPSRKKKEKGMMIVTSRKQVMITGNSQSYNMADGAVVDPTRLGTPPNVSYVPALK